MLYHNYSLLTYNTFGIDVLADMFFTFEDISSLLKFLNKGETRENIFVLGEGSNVLFTRNYNGLIIHPQNKGIKVIDEGDDFVKLEVQAGEDWDQFVAYAVSKQWYGIENLSLIPSSVGAVPVQNIGAYGVEVKDFIEEVTYVDIDLGKVFKLSANECEFGYRNSIFKTELKNKCIITSVVFKLKKNAELIDHYGDIKSRAKQYDSFGLEQMREVICDIRNEKLPDHKVLGNAGSFFKNPEVDSATAHKLKKMFPNISTYTLENGQYKLAAGWMIDYCGWKSYSENGVAVHRKQALVLVNKGVKSGKSVLYLAKKIQVSVFETFKINIEFEVNIL